MACSQPAAHQNEQQMDFKQTPRPGTIIKDGHSVFNPTVPATVTPREPPLPGDRDGVLEGRGPESRPLLLNMP